MNQVLDQTIRSFKALNKNIDAIQDHIEISKQQNNLEMFNQLMKLLSLIKTAKNNIQAVIGEIKK